MTRIRTARTAFALLALLALTALAFSACGGATSSSAKSNLGALDPKKQYTVDFWEAFGTGANKTALEQLTNQYMQQHPNIKVNLQAYPDYSTLQTKINAAIAAGAPPTMAQVYEQWAAQYQQNSQIDSLKPYIDGPNGLSAKDLSDFYPSLLKDGQINGAQYMLPFNKSDVALYYNADVLQQNGLTPPKTLDELSADIQKVTKSDGSQWGLSYTPSVDDWTALYKAFGGDKFVNDDGKTVAFNSGANAGAAKQALNYFTPMIQNKSVHVTKGYDWQNDFISAKSVFALSTIASYPFLAKPIGSTFKFDEAPFPAGPKGQFTPLFGTNVAIFSGASADNKAAAWDYIKYLTSADADAAFVQQTGYMPVRQSAYNSSALQSYYAQVPARKVGPQQLQNAFVPSILPAWSNCRDTIGTNFTAVLAGQLTADAALTKMAQDCNSALAQG